MLKPKRIPWPTDFSELSMKAGRYARGFREAFDAELHLLHVCAPLVIPGVEVAQPPGGELAVYGADVPPATREALQRLVAEKFDGDPTVVCEAVVGTPWYEICEYAKRAAIDLIVVATHGLTGLRHVLLGSTAERIVQHAECPVLTVKSLEKDFMTA
jgi:nucleotide-binding universal stress UspA family protein